MHKKSDKKLTDVSESSIYSSRFDLMDLSQDGMPQEGMPSNVAKQLIRDELNLESKPTLNLASFCTTWMEPEAEELILSCLNKNFIDHEEYPQIKILHARCVDILAELLNMPPASHYLGTATIGSSEAIMLAGLAHKFSWREKKRALGLDASKPNIVMGGNVQICWDKFAKYFDVEPRIIPLEKGKYTITAEDVSSYIDENTICVGCILGTTFTGEYDEIQETNDLLLKVKKEKGWDIPLHVDAASGGFVSMFFDDNIMWDFRLEQVKSINLSGHKYGLVYPGVGWLMFQNESSLPKELIFDVNYLGGSMPTFTLNFSRGSAMVVAQYYNYLRLGKEGFRKIVSNMMSVTDYLCKEIEKLDKFTLLGERRMEPVISLALKHADAYTVYDVSRRLKEKGWIVPAYSLPQNAQDVHSLRIVIKENFSRSLASDFLAHLNEVIEELEIDGGSKIKREIEGKTASH